MKRNSKTPPTLFIGIAIVVLLGMAYAIFDFIHRWHTRGDVFAQAEGGVLTFIVSGASALITLGFIYVTRRSLEVAQEANELQRIEWRQRVTVKPKFWFSPNSPAMHHFPLVNGKYTSAPFQYDGFEMVIWNYSEQSFLVHNIKLSIGGIEKKTRALDVSTVIPPHGTQNFDVSPILLDLICDQRAWTPEVLEKSILKSPFSLVSSIRYTDWQNTNQESALLINTVRVITREANQGELITHRLSISLERDSEKCL